MGVDLTLMPFDHDGGADGFSHGLLNCERRSELFEALGDGLRTHPVPDYFATFMCRDDKYEGFHYGNTQEDGYGEPLEWAFAADIVGFANHAGVTDNGLNRAVWAYLKELPPKTKVAIYWH